MEENKETPNEFDEFIEFEKNDNSAHNAIKVDDFKIEPQKIEPIKVNLVAKIENVTAGSGFTQTLDAGKIETLNTAILEDKDFKQDFTKKIKEAAQKSADVEVKKQELEKQNIDFHSEVLETAQNKNKNLQKVDKWENKQTKRQFAYNGLKPILKSIAVDEPLFIPLMYLLAFVILPFYLLGKLFRASIGNMLTGINDKDKKKEVKGLYWTILGFIAIVFVFFVIVLILNIFGAINWLW